MSQATRSTAQTVALSRASPRSDERSAGEEGGVRRKPKPELLTAIEDKGDPHSFPGYAKAREKFLYRCERLYEPSIYNMPWKASAKYLLPKIVYRAMSRMRGLLR